MNNEVLKNAKKEDGLISLAVILTVGLFAFILSATVAAGVLLEMNKNQNSAYGDKAFYASEASAKNAMKYFINKYKTDAAFKNSVISATNYSTPSDFFPPDFMSVNGINSSDVQEVTIHGNWPNFFASTKNSNTKSTRMVDIEFTVLPEGLGFDYALFVNNNADLSGSQLINGKVFSNANVELGEGGGSGNKGINGDLSSFGNVSGNYEELVTGVVNQNVSKLYSPTLADMQNCITSCPNVLYMDDVDNQLISNTTYGSSTNPIVIIVNGNLRIRGGVEVYGFIYVTGLTSFIGTSTIEGSIISSGYNGTSGNVTVTYNRSYLPNLAEIFSEEVINNSTPKFLSWKES